MGFHYFPLDYLEEGAPWFVDVTDKPELVIKPEDNGQLITNSEDKKMRKGLEYTAKRKVRRNNLHILVRQALATSFAAPLLSSSTLLSYLSVPALSSCPRLPIPLLSCPLVLTLLSYPLMLALLSCLFILALSSFLVLILLFLLVPTLTSHSVLGPALTWHTFSALILFK